MLVLAKLQKLVNTVKRLRANLYPVNWTTDPFIEIEQALQEIISGIAKEGDHQDIL